MTATPDYSPATWVDHEIEDMLEGPEPEWDSEPEAPPDAAHASGMLRRLGRLERDLASAREQADVRRAQIDTWLNDRTFKLQAQQDWIRTALEHYHQAVLALDPKRLTINLPDGKLASRMGQADWTFDATPEDEAAFMGWLIPDEIGAQLEAARVAYQDTVNDILAKAPAPEAVNCRRPPEPAVSLSGMKAELTRRDEDDPKKILAYGITASGEQAPGLTVTEPARKYDAKPTQPDALYPEPF